MPVYITSNKQVATEADTIHGSQPLHHRLLRQIVPAFVRTWAGRQSCRFRVVARREEG
jgi:hypothetical protein